MSWNLFLQIFQNLNITSREFRFVLGTHLLLQQGTSNTLWVFFSWLSRHVLFFNSVPETKTFCIFYSINFASHLQKDIAKTVALNCISPNCITHHAKIFTVTATTNATWENRKVRNIITRYRAMSIWVAAFSNITWNQWTSFK